MPSPHVDRRQFLQTMAAASAALSVSWAGCSGAKRPPNFVLVFCDDLGYGDLGSFGHPSTRTPNLDKMALEGKRWTNFYAAAPVCTPSRAALMTGRYPVRNGMCSNKRGVLFPDSAGGLPETEITIATALKEKGYATAAIGKWHLGHLPQYLPTSHGFDSYFGIPYSNDMDKVKRMSRDEQMDPVIEAYNVPLMRNEEVVERPADQNTITKRYTEEALKFIKDNKDQPFFVYLAHSMPHIPLFRSGEFVGKSERGYYGDVIEEIDWSVGQIIETLKNQGIDEDTLVVFCSDNGPWLIFNQHSGSAGHLRNGKGTTFEGGMRVPAIFRWPGKIKPNVVMDIGSTLDILPTFCTLAGVPVPDDRTIDGMSLADALIDEAASPRDNLIYHRGQTIYAARKGDYKVHYITENSYQKDNERRKHNPPLLYHLMEDPSEKYDIADKHPEIIEEINAMVAEFKKTLGPATDNLVARIPGGPEVL